MSKKKRREFGVYKRVDALMKTNNTCEICGASGKLHVHHKDFDSMNNSSSNTQPVCPECHIELHKEHDKREFDKHTADVYEQDLKTEAEIRNAWVKSGRSFDEIGGEEFAEFFLDYSLNRSR